MAEFLREARAGGLAYRWLHDLICRSGYAPIAADDDERILVGIRRLAAHLGVTRRTLEHWRREGLPLYRPGVGSRPMLFDVLEVLAWRGERDRARQDLETDPLLQGEGKGYWIEQYRKERTLEARRRNAIEEGKLIVAVDVATRLAEIARRFRDGIEGVGRRHGAAVARDVATLVDDMIADLARTAGDPEREEISECQDKRAAAAPAAKPAGKRARRRAGKRGRRKRQRPARSPAG